jgi:hypothetical protein
MHNFFNLHLLAPAVATLLCGPGKTISTLDVTESMVGGTAVTHVGTVQPARYNSSIT